MSQPLSSIPSRAAMSVAQGTVLTSISNVEVDGRSVDVSGDHNMREDTVETILDAWADPPCRHHTPLSISNVPPQRDDGEGSSGQIRILGVATFELGNDRLETTPNDYESRKDQSELNHAITNNAPGPFQHSCDQSLHLFRPVTHLTHAGRAASTLLQKAGTISSSSSSLTLVADANAQAPGSQVVDLSSKGSDNLAFDNSIPCKTEEKPTVQWSSILPILPILHIALVAVHLALSIVIPYLLVTHLIQPLVLWLVMIATLLLELGYLLAVLILETIGVFRKRPLSSAWLQSGLHLTLFCVFALPHTLCLVLLLMSTQVPSCSSALNYIAPSVSANYAAYLSGTPCEVLPTTVLLSLVNLVLVLLIVGITGAAIDLDARIHRRSSSEGRRKLFRRWLVGTGELLWGLELHFARRGAHRRP